MTRKRNEDADEPQPGGMPELPLLDGPLASAVRESAQQIWQAGLGAFAKAQGEGSKVFDSLVREGVSLQRRTQAAAEERWGTVGSRMQRLSDEVQTRAGQQWDRLESIFEDRVAKALARLDVPSGQELEALAARVDALARQVEALAAAPARPAAPRKAAAQKLVAAKQPGAARKSAAAAGGARAAPRKAPRKAAGKRGD